MSNSVFIKWNNSSILFLAFETEEINKNEFLLKIYAKWSEILAN